MSDHKFLIVAKIFGMIGFIVLVARGISIWKQQQACARLGYPRSVDVGNLWPIIKCVKLVNGTEVLQQP